MIIELDLTDEETNNIVYIYDEHFRDSNYDNVTKDDILSAIEFAYINLEFVKRLKIDLSHTERFERHINAIHKQYNELQKYCSDPLPTLDRLPDQPSLTFSYLESYLSTTYKVDQEISESIFKSLYYVIFGKDIKAPKHRTKPQKAVKNFIEGLMHRTAKLHMLAKDHAESYKKR